VSADRKVAVVGLDSITPVMIERFLAEGRMPNLERMRERGFSSEITPTMPPTTPAGWTTVATGAWPSTHGVEGFAVHDEGRPLDQKRHSCHSDAVKAEFIWQAAERAGKRTVLLKYPLSWPFRGGPLVTQVDGAAGWGGIKCVFDLVHSGSWDTNAAAPEAAGDGQALGQEWLTRDIDTIHDESTQALAVRAPAAWVNLPAGAGPLWETAMDLRHRGMGAGVTVHALAFETGGVERLLLARARDGAGARPLAAGDWSDWLDLDVPTPDGERRGHLRVKVMAFDAPARRLRLYQSQVHQATGFTRPASLAAELLEAAGPFVEWTESYERQQGWIDDQTQLEIYEQHAGWMSRASRHLLRRQGWDLFMAEVHSVDMAYHLYWGAAMPGHPQHNPAKAGYYWDLLGRAHELADQYLGAVREAAGEDALVIVLGDHGHDMYHTNVLSNHLLLHAGLLALYRDRRTGEPRIDWKSTRAYASGYRVYLNVAGRDPDGIVPPGEYRATQERVIQTLYRLADPRTQDHPVRLAVRREDAEAIGLYGGSMGDVVFAMAPGFETRNTIHVPADAWLGGRLQLDRVPVFKQTEMFREFSGDHDTALPFTRSIRSLLFLDGPAVRAGRRRVPVRMVDIAPTICHYLGIPFPAQCEGSPLWEAFSE